MGRGSLNGLAIAGLMYCPFYSHPSYCCIKLALKSNELLPKIIFHFVSYKGYYIILFNQIWIYAYYFRCNKRLFTNSKLMRYFIVSTGGFYQDEIAGGLFERNGTGCKYCLKGRYVHPSKAPGKTDEDCQVCPEGIIY